MINDMPQIIERYGDPSCLDSAPFLSVCLNTNDQSAWVQIAKDDLTPHWERFTSLEDALEFVETKKNIE
jgi:hypothetical protein